MFVGNSIKKFYQTVSESAEMLEILQTSHEIQDYTNESLLVKDGKIVFRNVDFAYGEAENVFNNLSLSIKFTVLLMKSAEIFIRYCLHNQQ